MRNVVAVSDVGEAQILKITEMTLQREVVSQRLAGMFQIAQCVDHRHGRVLGHAFDRLLGRTCAV